ncbi:hypothetical protein Y032_0139g2109 [Ancylostoma ceylanicum]|uniref:Uncharacterized protein n=1 Tax=Ancylostoma ceylanicum TaxID=53326 RepID=A0A016T4T9_9BILA|nr:hypothetical protein Y032_0139g2109 [Ancylostoma ceylanicum]
MRICSRLFSALVHFHNPTLWPNELKTAVATGCRVTPSFITEEEENELLREVEPHMKRLRYEKSHWDDAIHLYREREQRKWSPANEKVIQRIRILRLERLPMKCAPEMCVITTYDLRLPV